MGRRQPSWWSWGSFGCPRTPGIAVVVALLVVVVVVVVVSLCFIGSRSLTGARLGGGAALASSDSGRTAAAAGAGTHHPDDQAATHGHEEEEEVVYIRIIGRRLLSSGLGSHPPRCTSKCGSCDPCYPVHMSVPPGVLVTTEYYPEAWRCKCRNQLYMP